MFVIIEEEIYPVDTIEQIEEVETLLAQKGLPSSTVCVGDSIYPEPNGVIIFAKEASND